MSNIKKGSKLTVSTGNGISRASSNNLGILELSGPGLENVVSQDSTFSLDSSNVPQLTIGAIDNSGIFQLGLDNQGNAILESTQNGSNNNVLIQQLGGYVGIGTNNPASTFHVNSTDALIIPVGTDANRPGESGQITAQNGMIRYNTDTSQFEGYGPGSAWGSLGGVIDGDGDTKIIAETYATADNDELQFYTDGQERMSINSVGDVSMNGDITTSNGYPYYQSLGTENIVNPPSTTRTVYGVNITAMNKRTRASYASAEACVETWTARSAGQAYASENICWSPELSIFVSTVYGKVLTSSDGNIWTVNTAPNGYWRYVCWSPELSIFVAVAHYGTYRVMTSPDGINWTLRSAASGEWIFICWSPELSIFVALAVYGTYRVMTSPDGINWTGRSVEGNGWRSVCWSPELSIFVAVGYLATNRVLTSPDGITWTGRSVPTSNWWSVCWSPELSIFVAVASYGTNQVMTSPDGITWTARSAAEANEWFSVCWSPELSIFVAVAKSGTNRVMTSPDGITWTARSAQTNDWMSVCWSPELSIFAAIGYDENSPPVMTSNIGMPNSKSVVKALPSQMSVLPNGNVGIGTTNPSYKLDVNGTAYFRQGITSDTGYPYYQTLGTENIVNPPSTTSTVFGVNITAMNKRTRASYASAEACVETWTARSAAEANYWRSVCWSPELSIFVSVADSGTNRVMTSPDGITWTARSASEANNWYSVCWSPELSIFVSVANSGTNRVMTSPDGITWTGRSTPSSNWGSVCWSPELSIFVAVASYGTNQVMTSPDGITWTSRSASEASGWLSVCWSPELSIFVAVAYAGTNLVMTSPDGITWTSRSASEANYWYSVCWSPELSIFVAVTDAGTNQVMTSPDGITWTARSTSEANAWWSSVCWSPELSIFVAVASYRTNQVMTSPDGINWTARSASEDNGWYSVCWSPELSIFVAVSASGTNQVMTSNIGMPNSKSVVKALPSQMSVLPNGKVGIGTTEPKSKFNVFHNGTHSSSTYKMKRFSVNVNTHNDLVWQVYYGLSWSFFNSIERERLDGNTNPDGRAVIFKNEYNIIEWMKDQNIDISFNTSVNHFPAYDQGESNPTIFQAYTISLKAKQDCEFYLLSQAYIFSAGHFNGYAMVYDLYNNDFYTLLFPYSDDYDSYCNGISPSISLKAGRYYKIYFYTVLLQYSYYGGNDYAFAWQTIPQSTISSTSGGYNMRSIHSNDISSNITEWFTYINDSDYIEWVDEHDINIKVDNHTCSFSINDTASNAPLSVVKEYLHDLSNNTIAEFKGIHPVKILDNGYINTRGINDMYITKELAKVNVTKWINTTSAPSARYAHSMFISEDRYLYVMGGINSSGAAQYDILFQYDLINNTWNTNSQYAGNRAHEYSFWYDDSSKSLYTFGGRLGSSYYNFTHKYVINNSNYSYTYSLITSNGASGSPSSRRFSAMVKHENYLYLFGGENGSSYYNDFWKLDLDTNTWSQIHASGTANTPSARARHSMNIYKHYIYVIGGFNGSNNIDDTSMIWMYDLYHNSSAAWKQVHFSQSAYTPSISSRTLVSTIVENFMIIFNGNDRDGKDNRYMHIINLDNHTIERHTNPYSISYTYPTQYSKKLGKFYIFSGYDDTINATTDQSIREYTPYFTTVLKNNSVDLNTWFIREGSSFYTYTWLDFQVYAKSYGTYYDWDLPTNQWLLEHSKQLEERANQTDWWIPCYGPHGEKTWAHLGSTAHPHLKIHLPYPSWGDSNTSHNWRRGLIMVRRNKKTVDLKIEANRLIVRSEAGVNGDQQDALTITSHNNAINNDSSTKETTCMSILAPGDSQYAAIYFGTQYMSEKFRARKTAIIVEGANNYDQGNIHFCTENSTDDNDVAIDDSRMVIKSDGNVGIGTTSPNYPLEIVGNDGNTTTLYGTATVHDGGSYFYSNHANNISNNISVKTSHGIWAGADVVVSSDKRIKEKIEEVPDALALQQVRTIPCKYYEYKDKYKKGFGKTIGFIAQEVREILPMAVNLQTNFVPDEMRVLTDISWNGTTLYTDISGSSARYRFYVSDDLSGNGAIEKEIMGSGSTGFKFDKQYNFVFCYGKKVNDFHTLDKHKLFALNFSATQELDRIQQQQIIDISNANTIIQTHETTIQTLQTDLSNANTTIQQQATTIQTLETQIADILTRLSNLENTGST